MKIKVLVTSFSSPNQYQWGIRNTIEIEKAVKYVKAQVSEEGHPLRTNRPNLLSCYFGDFLVTGALNMLVIIGIL